MKIIYQNKENDCGLACCTMIINHFHIENLTLSDIEKNYPVINSLSISEVEDILYKHNISSKSYEVSFADLVKHKYKHPFIAMVKHLEQSHFVVVKEIHKDLIIYMDPAQGQKEVSFAEFKSIFLGFVLLPEKPDVILDFSERKLVFENYKFIAKVLVLEFLIFLSMTISVGFLRVILDVFIEHKDAQQLIAISLWFFLVAMVRFLLMYVLQIVKAHEIKKVYGEFTHKVIKQIFEKDKSFFNPHNRAKFISLDEHLQKTAHFATSSLPTIITGLMFICFSVSFFWLLDAQFVILWILISTIQASVSIFIKSKYKKHIIKLKDSYVEFKQGLLNAYDVAENNSGDLKIENTVNSSLKLKEKYFKNYKKYSLLEKDTHLIMSVLEFFFSQIYAIVGVLLIWKGHATIGTVIFVLSFNSHITHQIENLFSFYTSLPDYRNSESVVKNFLFVKNTLSSTGVKPKRFNKSILVKRLTCEKDDVQILNNFNAKFIPWTIITGSTGTGKSTLMNCISKKLNFWNGDIYFGEVPLKEIDGEYIREKVIHSNNYLPVFNCTIKNFLGTVVEDLKISKYIKKHNLNIERNINSNLSSGQKEIINFLHTIGQKADYFFFDEPLPHVDAKQRRELYKLAKSKLKNKFVVVISHDVKVRDIFEREVAL